MGYVRRGSAGPALSVIWGKLPPGLSPSAPATPTGPPALTTAPAPSPGSWAGTGTAEGDGAVCSTQDKPETGLVGPPCPLSPLSSLGRAVTGPRGCKVISQELADGESCFPGVAREECSSSEVLSSSAPCNYCQTSFSLEPAAPAPGVGAMTRLACPCGAHVPSCPRNAPADSRRAEWGVGGEHP